MSYSVDDDGVDLILYLIDDEYWVDIDFGFVLFVAFFDYIIFESVDRHDEVVRKLGDEMVFDGLNTIENTSSPFF